jgi:hypothetical protein
LASERGRGRLAAFAAATLIGYVVANAVTPSLVVPQRYVQFAIPILVPLGIVAGLRGLFPRRLGPDGFETPARRRWIFGFMLAVGTLVLLVFGGDGRRGRYDDVTLQARSRSTPRSESRRRTRSSLAGRAT